MKALLTIEWLKIKRYRTAWVLSGLFLTFIFLINIFIDTEVISLGGNGINVFNSDYSFFAVWKNATYWTKEFAGLIALMVVILTTNEYQYRTHRQNVLDGWKRSEFFHAKWYLVVAVAAAITMFTFLLGTTQALLSGSSITGIGHHIEKLFYLFILLLNYGGFALTLSFLLKRTGLTIVIFILYAYPLEGILYLVSTHPDIADFAYFLPMESSAGLLTFPPPEVAKQMMPKFDRPSDIALLCCSLGYITLYYFLGRWKLLKGDW